MKLLNMKFFAFFSTALLFASTPSIVSAQLLPVEEYTKPPVIQKWSLSLSPTGEFVAVIVPQNDRSSLIVFDRKTNAPTANITPKKGQYIHDYQWVNDRRIVLSMEERDGALSTPIWTGELWGIDADGKNNRYLFGYRAENATGSNINRATAIQASATVLDPNADEKNSILIGIQSWSKKGDVPFLELARLNIMDGSVINSGGKIPLRYLSSAFVDKGGKVRVVSGINPDLKTQLLYKNPKTEEWITINDEKKTDRAIMPLGYNRSGTDIYARVSESGTPDYLILLNPDTLAEKKIYVPKYANFGILFPTADKQDAYAIESKDGRGGYVFLDKNLPEANLIGTLMSQFPGELVIATSFSRDGRYASIFVFSDVNPGEYFILDRDAKSLSAPIKIRPNINPDTSAVVEPIEFKARDGLTIHGWLTKPHQANAKLPMIVLPHGGPYGIQDHWVFNEEAQLFASRGYAVLQVNFRGSGGYGKDFLDAGWREWGAKMQNDITDATRWAIDQKQIDSGRICIYGGSYGAYAALMGVATEPGLFKCAIGYSGVYDLAILQRRSGDIDDTAAGRNYLESLFPDDPAILKARSPVELAGQIKAPVLLIHGGEDKRTPVAHALAMKKALTAVGNPPEWVYETSEGHGFFDPKKRLNAYQRMIDFLDKNIGPGVKNENRQLESSLSNHVIPRGFMWTRIALDCSTS